MKLKGPSLSPEASGSLADVLTFSRSAKSPYAKKHAAPSNPKSGPQTAVRAMMRFLSQNWITLSPADVLTWETLAYDRQIAPYHAYIAENMKRWKTHRFPSKAYPATETVVIPATIYQNAFGGKAHIRVELVNGGGFLPWGFATYRRTTPFGPLTWDQIVNVILRVGTGWNKWNDTPLTPGTYYYRSATFTDTGFPRMACPQDSATAT